MWGNTGAVRARSSPAERSAECPFYQDQEAQGTSFASMSLSICHFQYQRSKGQPLFVTKFPSVWSPGTDSEAIITEGASEFSKGSRTLEQ